ncbi:hypothetical protein OESDEN_06842 [Oesophagostomum dentatum]|uniref:Uncharacterized protein n=1 Tax=Oesophagostomum dentatum TaxID=61180 RepID=A0A0B1T6S3_OESDE|nr:hypothetical protein OESDEN_06842 [Oesophagostomum dentatum]
MDEKPKQEKMKREKRRKTKKMSGPSHFLSKCGVIRVSFAGASSSEHHYMMCILNNANNILSMVNATIPFFVFLICNEQFRHMTTMYIKAQLQRNNVRKENYLSQAVPVGEFYKALIQKGYLK